MRRKRLLIAVGATLAMLSGIGVGVATAGTTGPASAADEHRMIEDFSVTPNCSGLGTFEVLIDAVVFGDVDATAAVSVHPPQDAPTFDDLPVSSFRDEYHDPFSGQFEGYQTAIGASKAVNDLVGGYIVTIKLRAFDKQDPQSWSAEKTFDVVSPGCERTEENPRWSPKPKAPPAHEVRPGTDFTVYSVGCTDAHRVRVIGLVQVSGPVTANVTYAYDTSEPFPTGTQGPAPQFAPYRTYDARDYTTVMGDVTLPDAVAEGTRIVVHLSVADESDPTSWSVGKYMETTAPAC